MRRKRDSCILPLLCGCCVRSVWRRGNRRCCCVDCRDGENEHRKGGWGNGDSAAGGFFFSQTRTNGTGAIQKAALTKRRRAFSSCLEYFLLVFIYLLLRNEKKKRHQNKLRRPKGKLPKGERKNKNPRKSRVEGASPKRDGALPRMSQHLVIGCLSQREDRRRDKEHGRKHREDLLVG